VCHSPQNTLYIINQQEHFHCHIKLCAVVKTILNKIKNFVEWWHPRSSRHHLCCHTAAVAEVKNDEFWDYDRQLDLEAFSSQTLYDVLSRQARDVTRNLGEQKEQVRLNTSSQPRGCSSTLNCPWL